ncbi:hypothetical protein ACNOYE_02930 [Nannocystaceae bacterium ST9]
MHRLHLLVSLIGFAGAFGVGACFIESPKPSTFRFACETSDECDETQVCTDGLCQQACGGPDDAKCSDTEICFNGYCSSVCPVAEDVCPEPQTCVTFADPSSDEPPTSGLCAVLCDEQDHPCAEGDVCVEGVCLSTCTSDDDCDAGASCIANVCISGA